MPVRTSREGRLCRVEPLIDELYVAIPLSYDDERSAANLVVTATRMPDGTALYRCP